MNTPVHALENRGVRGNLVGYMVYGDYRDSTPASRIIDGVANGDVDVAIVWGPLAGYFAKRSKVPLDIVPVFAGLDLPSAEIRLRHRDGCPTRRHDVQVAPMKTTPSTRKTYARAMQLLHFCDEMFWVGGRPAACSS